MAKREKYVKPKSTLEMTWDELWESNEKTRDCYNMEVYGSPSRDFQLGEHVILGNLKNVTISHIYGNGIYAIHVPYPAGVGGILPSAENRIVKWVDIEKSKPKGNTRFVDDMYRRPNYLSSSFDSMIHMHRHNGFVMDTRFQREYVWTNADKEALIDTVFNQGTIGSFIFNRHFGFSFANSDEVNEFRNIVGDTIKIPKKDNFCVSIIDGQQRLTTLLNFYYGRWAYKGYYFSDLSFKDQHTFTGMPISYALVDESDGWTLKDWVWLFLQANKGVSQSREHLAKMEEYYIGLFR
jgi:hypothetical protein